MQSSPASCLDALVLSFAAVLANSLSPERGAPMRRKFVPDLSLRVPRS